jgi:hypothetical protein
MDIDKKISDIISIERFYEIVSYIANILSAEFNSDHDDYYNREKLVFIKDSVCVCAYEYLSSSIIFKGTYIIYIKMQYMSEDVIGFYYSIKHYKKGLEFRLTDYRCFYIVDIKTITAETFKEIVIMDKLSSGLSYSHKTHKKLTNDDEDCVHFYTSVIRQIKINKIKELL